MALYTAQKFREAHREFRAVIASKEGTSLDTARAVSGAAFCLAARGRFHEAAKEYSRVRRRLQGEGALVQQYLLQGEMKAALGTAGRWSSRRDSRPAFALPEAGGAFRAREIAAEIVKTVSEDKENGLDKTRGLLAKIEADPSRGYAYLYACQLAMPKVPTDPPQFLGFAKAVEELMRCLPSLGNQGPAQPVCREQVLGEAGLLESNALNHIGLSPKAAAAARRARLSFVAAGEDRFSLAFADYFEGAPLVFSGEFAAAWRLLKSARSEFQLFGQENFQGRVQAVLGLLAAYRGKYSSALHCYDEALRTLHPDRDGSSYTQVLVNWGGGMINLGRLEEAKAALARALMHARRLQMNTTLLTIRFGLASIDLLKGNVARALRGFERIASDAERMGFDEFVLGAQLRIAECLSRLGRSDDVPKRIEEIRRSPYAVSLSNEVEFRELFESVEAPSAGQIAHIADYFEGGNRGVRIPFKPFRLVGKAD
ncbi:MAG TPA: hypothetical protein VF368_06055 [Gemmatimonadaceae bacterium]